MGESHCITISANESNFLTSLLLTMVEKLLMKIKKDIRGKGKILVLDYFWLEKYFQLALP